MITNEFDDKVEEERVEDVPEDGTSSVGDQEKMTKWKNEPTIADLKQNITEAETDQGTHKTNVERWLKNRAAERPKAKGRSSIQPKLIRKHGEWRYSSLADPFLSTPDIFNVNPVTAGDVNRAKQNELVLNNQFNTQIDKVAFIDDYVREAVDIGTVIVKVAWESLEEDIEELVPEFEYMPEQDPRLAEHYMTLLQLRVQNPERYADFSTPGLDHALQVFQETGVALHAQPTGKKERVRKTILAKNAPTVEVCPSENIIIDPTCGRNLEKARFIGEKEKMSLSDLKKDGRYKNLDKINVINAANPETEPDFTGSPDATAFTFKDKPRQQFVVYTYWGEWDINGDDTTEQIVASWVGDVCIRMERSPYPDRKPPFVSAVYMPVRGSAFGEPDGELLADNQDIIGAVTRGAIDLLAKSANGQTGMRKDMLDPLNRRRFKAGENYEFNAGVDPRLGVFQHSFPEIPRSVFEMLSLQSNEAESLSGVKAYDSGVSSASLGNVASLGRSALDASAKRELGIMRRLAHGVIQIGRKIIAMNAEFLSDKEVVRITDQEFIQVRRDDLAGKFDLRLSISTAEEDAQKAQQLAFMLQTAGPNMDLDFQKTIWGEIADLQKMPGLAKRIRNFQPEPDPIAQAKAAKELELMDAQIRKEDALAFKHISEGEAATGRGYKDQTQGDLNTAKAGEAGAKARKHGSEADRLDQDYLRKESGQDHLEARDLQDQRDGNQLIREVATADQHQPSGE